MKSMQDDEAFLAAFVAVFANTKTDPHLLSYGNGNRLWQSRFKLIIVVVKSVKSSQKCSKLSTIHISKGCTITFV